MILKYGDDLPGGAKSPTSTDSTGNDLPEGTESSTNPDSTGNDLLEVTEDATTLDPTGNDLPEVTEPSTTTDPTGNDLLEGTDSPDPLVERGLRPEDGADSPNKTIPLTQGQISKSAYEIFVKGMRIPSDDPFWKQLIEDPSLKLQETFVEDLSEIFPDTDRNTLQQIFDIVFSEKKLNDEDTALLEGETPVTDFVKMLEKIIVYLDFDFSFDSIKESFCRNDDPEKFLKAVMLANKALLVRHLTGLFMEQKFPSDTRSVEQLCSVDSISRNFGVPAEDCLTLENFIQTQFSRYQNTELHDRFFMLERRFKNLPRITKNQSIPVYIPVGLDPEKQLAMMEQHLKTFESLIRTSQEIDPNGVEKEISSLTDAISLMAQEIKGYQADNGRCSLSALRRDFEKIKELRKTFYLQYETRVGEIEEKYLRFFSSATLMKLLHGSNYRVERTVEALGALFEGMETYLSRIPRREEQESISLRKVLPDSLFVDDYKRMTSTEKLGYLKQTHAKMDQTLSDLREKYEKISGDVRKGFACLDWLNGDVGRRGKELEDMAKKYLVLRAEILEVLKQDFKIPSNLVF